MSECDCAMHGAAADADEACEETGPSDLMCSKPAGHDGPHAACSVLEHPAEVWE